ncbi:MAG: HIT domain-containing protein [archaeon]|nr:HIT domain-containing protein [archaeon]
MLEQPKITEEQKKQLEEKLKKMSPEEIAAFQKQQCVFCKIIDGSIPSTKIYEDDRCIVVLDINPSTKGHVLLIPKHHYAIMPQVSDEDLGHLFVVAKKLSQILLKGLKVSGTNIFIANGPAAGQRAQHFLIHIIPRKEGDKLLPVKEKIIDHDMQEKVKLAIERSLNKLLGVKSVTSPKVEVEKKPAVIDADLDVEEIFGSKNKDKFEEQDDELEEDSEDSEEKEGGANLDEIANLFK